MTVKNTSKLNDLIANFNDFTKDAATGINSKGEKVVDIKGEASKLVEKMKNDASDLLAAGGLSDKETAALKKLTGDSDTPSVLDQANGMVGVKGAEAPWNETSAGIKDLLDQLTSGS